MDGYGLPTTERQGLAARVAQRMGVTADGIESLASNGEPAFVRLAENGVPAQIGLDRAWVVEHAEMLDAAIV